LREEIIVSTCIHITSDLNEDLKRIAKGEKRTWHAIVNIFLSKGIRRYKGKIKVKNHHPWIEGRQRSYRTLNIPESLNKDLKSLAERSNETWTGVVIEILTRAVAR
jgi:hypothetical protein